MRALILSGSGRYADPWHPLSATSGRIERLLTDAGAECITEEDVDFGLAHAGDFDLLVVNAGDPWRGEAHGGPVPSDASQEGLAASLRRGIGVLAFHCSTASLRDYPDWAPALGRVWLPSVSFHPTADIARISGGSMPDGERVDDFDVFDERYCRLQPVGAVHTVATHRGEDHAEPTAWVKTYAASRIAVDLLGHDERSYDASGHRALVLQLSTWAVRR